MATEVINIVDPDAGSGYDYDSLSDWEAGEQANIVAADEQHTAKCRCTGGTADTTAVTIAGWTTDSTCFIKIWTDPEESYRHDGTYQTGNKYRLEYTGNGIIIQEGNVNLEGLQISLVCPTDFTYYNALSYTTSGVDGDEKIEKCVFYLSSTAFTQRGRSINIATNATTGIDWIIANNVFYSAGVGGSMCRGIENGDNNSSGTVYIYNNTFKTLKVAIFISLFDGADCYVKNCGFVSCTTGISGTADGTATNSTSTPTFDTDGIHLDSTDNTWKDQGTDLSGEGFFTDDIDGDTRSGSWDIGADEYVAAGGALSIPVAMRTYRNMRI